MATYNPETKEVELSESDKKCMEITEPEQLDEKQTKRFEKYLQESCTSGCGNDFDCPHEEEFFDMLNAEIKEGAHQGRDDYDDRLQKPEMPNEVINVLTERD